MNDLWKAVGVSVLTSVVVFFILYFAVGQVMFSPLMPATPTTREINANSCNADGVCETETLKSLGGAIYIGQSPNGIKIARTSEGNLGIAGANGVDILGDLYAQLVNVAEVKTGPVTASELLVSVNANQQVRINPFVESAIVVTTFSGNGTAYACINSQGGFYRSQTPCI